mmetsp:Transcript_15479/g.19167  ORF Transcript_15479/g.19167 Transcript_15479/m.19167 type:complete len:185 (-) Transcript_15479:53-607(-)
MAPSLQSMETVIAAKDVHKYIVIGGPHHTGTSLLRLLLAENHEDVSIQNASVRFEGEGQHLQTVYAVARQRPCDYALVPDYYMSEKDFHPNQIRIFKEWNIHWNLSKPILVEKSPPNIIKSRWLQYLYDFANKEVHFVFLMRHPMPILMKLTKCEPETYVENWLTMLETLEKEIDSLHSAYFIR